MNKIFVGIVGITAIIAIFWFANQSSQVDFVATVNDEVTAIETELAEIDAAVAAGTLSPTEAADARIAIITRLESINTTVRASESVTVSKSQQSDIAKGLERLKLALLQYQTTIDAIDVAAEKDVTQQKKFNQGTVHYFGNTLALFEEFVVDVNSDYDATVTVDELLEDIVPQDEPDMSSDEEMSGSDEDMDQDTESVEPDDSTEETETTDDTSATLEAELEVETTLN